MTNRKLEITVIANPDADDCLAEAVSRHLAEYPDLAGYDLDPRWTDESTRKTVTLTVPRWHYDHLQQTADES